LTFYLIHIVHVQAILITTILHDLPVSKIQDQAEDNTTITIKWTAVSTRQQERREKSSRGQQRAAMSSRRSKATFASSRREKYNINNKRRGERSV